MRARDEWLRHHSPTLFAASSPAATRLHRSDSPRTIVVTYAEPMRSYLVRVTPRALTMASDCASPGPRSPASHHAER